MLSILFLTFTVFVFAIVLYIHYHNFYKNAISIAADLFTFQNAYATLVHEGYVTQT